MITEQQDKDLAGPHINEKEPSLNTDITKLDSSNENSLTDWKNEPTIQAIKEDLEYARQDNEDQKTNVNGWLALRNTTGNESGNKNKLSGRSKVQPKLIRKHNEWRYPALSEPFLNTERMFSVNPRTWEDQESAKQNELVLNWQFDTKLNKVAFIDKMVRKTVDEGTCVIRTGWERRTEKVKVDTPVYEYYELTDPEQLAILAKATESYIQDKKAFENNRDVPESLLASVEYGIEHNTPVRAEEVSTTEVVKEIVTWNAPVLKIINTENFFIDPSCEGDWEKAQYAIYTYESTESDLKMRGIYKNLNKVSWSENAIKSQIGNQDHITKTPITDSRLNTQKTKVLVYEYWGLYDIHDDGILVPIVVTFIGDTIIQMEENPFPDRKIPFVIIPYMPIDKSCFGEADASLLQENQRILGATTRGMIDLLGRSANAQIGYAKGMLDPVNKKRFTQGEDFEFNPNTDPRISIQQMTYPEIPRSALEISQIQNAEAEGLSGIKGFSGGITGESYGKVARGISGAMDAASQREMSILRRLAEGMRIIGSKIISMNEKFLQDTEVIRITNSEFIKIKRKDLAGNFDLIVDISTAQVDEQKSNDLGFMLQTMGPDMDPGLSKMILGEIADLKRMPELAEKIRSYEPKPDPIQQEIQKLQLEKLKSEIELDRSRAILAQADAENKALKTHQEDTGISHNRVVEAQGAQARGNRDLEITKALLKGETDPDNIAAGVGFNQLVENKNNVSTNQTNIDSPIEPNNINQPIN